MDTVRNRSAIMAMLLRAAEQAADWPSVVAIAEELEAVAMQRETAGPSGDELLEWACENGIGFDRMGRKTAFDRGLRYDKINGVCYARWVDDAMQTHYRSGLTWRDVILRAMSENAAIDSAPDLGAPIGASL